MNTETNWKKPGAVIVEHAAFVVLAPTSNVLAHGNVIALPFDTINHGVQWHRFRVGTVAGMALDYGDNPAEMIARCKQSMKEDPHAGHKLQWLNPVPAMLTSERRPQETCTGFVWGVRVVVEGETFTIEKAPNNNAKFVPAAAKFDPDLVQIERKRRSVTQGSAVVSYDGRQIGHYDDAIQLDDNGEYHGRSDEYWVDVARRAVESQVTA